MRRWIGPAIGAGAMAAVVLFSAPPSWAWGPEAHRVIALIAEQNLQKSDPAVRTKLAALLATDKGDKLVRGDIADEATWADVLADKSPEARTATMAWHSVRFDPRNPDLDAACFGRKSLPAGYPASHGPQDNCAVDKIEQFETELSDPGTSPYERLAAVQFLLSLVADVNDPMRAINYGDRGGDCIALQVGGKPPVRLVTYWEETLVREVVGGNPAAAAPRIAAAIPPAQVAQLSAGNAESWAREAYDIAKSVTYSFMAEKPAGAAKFPTPKGQTEACASIPLYKVGADYETKALAAVRLQIARASYRLARVLRDGLK